MMQLQSAVVSHLALAPPLEPMGAHGSRSFNFNRLAVSDRRLVGKQSRYSPARASSVQVRDEPEKASALSNLVTYRAKL